MNQSEIDSFRNEWLKELISKDDKIKDCKVYHKSRSKITPSQSLDNQSPKAFQITQRLLKGDFPKNENLTEWEFHKRDVTTAEFETTVKIKKRASLVELLIKDLDEVNEIPFFDITLPREVALKIFKHLDIRDLCSCAMVSKCWKNLAEDEYLWWKICINLGYEKNCLVIDRSNWKIFVMKSISNERDLRSNWKNRCGKLYELDDPQAGVLCCASSNDQSIIAGYSNGKVNIWKLGPKGNKEEFFYVKGEQVTHVLTNDDIHAAAFLNSGILIYDINSEIVNSIFADQFPITQMIANQNSLIASWNNVICRWVKDCSVQIRLGSKVTHLTSLDSSLIVACEKTINMFNSATLSMDHSKTVHHLFDSSVNCLDAGQSYIAAGIVCRTDENIFQVPIFSLETGNYIGKLGSHTSGILFVNLHSTPSNLILTGCRDKRARIFDLRTLTSSLSLEAHSMGVTQGHLDDDNLLITGGEDGLVCVWDIRHARNKLWEMYSRHPIDYLKKGQSHLVTANIPCNKNPNPDDNDLVVHTRQRGLIRVYDFSVSQQLKNIPSICLSTYDEPAGYNYNIKLAVPYDQI